MQDGAPPHFAIDVYEWLNAHFPEKWMGRDMTPCVFYLCGWLKEQVYIIKPTTLVERDGRTREVMSSIPQEFLVKSVDAVPSRLEKLVVNAGTHIEL